MAFAVAENSTFQGIIALNPKNQTPTPDEADMNS